jgi:hypothetical protein
MTAEFIHPFAVELKLGRGDGWSPPDGKGSSVVTMSRASMVVVPTSSLY